jgi:DNA-binding transcriptional LysR family regulator
MVDLVEEAFDVAIRLAPTADSSMVVRPLVTFRFVVSGAPAYFARQPAPARPADLAEHNCLRYSFFPAGREWTFTGPDGAESVRISGNLETNSADALRAAALGGQGVLLSPGFLVAQDLSAGRLVPALTDYQAPQLPISAIYPHRRLLSAKVRHFIDLVALRFADEAFWRG